MATLCAYLLTCIIIEILMALFGIYEAQFDIDIDITVFNAPFRASRHAHRVPAFTSEPILFLIDYFFFANCHDFHFTQNTQLRRRRFSFIAIW